MEEDLTTDVHGLHVFMNRKQFKRHNLEVEKQRAAEAAEAAALAGDTETTGKAGIRNIGKKGIRKLEKLGKFGSDSQKGGETLAQRERERGLREERLTARVEEMFSPAPYRKGLTLERLQLMLLSLQHIPRDELIQWLDIFETQWAIEKRKNADELRHLSALFKDCDTQASLGSTSLASLGAQTEELEKKASVLRLLGQADQPNEEVDLDDVSIEMKWARLAMAAGCCKGSGMSVFRLPQMLPVVRKTHENYEKKMTGKLEQIREDARQVAELTKKLQQKEVTAQSLASDPAVQALLSKPSMPSDPPIKTKTKGQGTSNQALEDAEVPLDVRKPVPKQKLRPTTDI